MLNCSKTYYIDNHFDFITITYMNQNTNKYYNINFVSKNSLCLYCGTCYGVCPKKNVKIESSENGNPVFKIANQDKCGNCHICYNVCPGQGVDFEKLHKDVFNLPYTFSDVVSYRICYIGHSNDIKIRYNSASGGFVSSILINALKNKSIDGALVVKLDKNDPLKPKVYIAKSKSEVLNSFGSKYLTVSLNTGLREIIKSEKERKYAVVGLPCHIHGVRKAQSIFPELKRKIVFTIGLFCGRGTSPKGTEFILKRLGVKKTDLAKLEYRKGKWPGYFSAIQKNGEEKILAFYDFVNVARIFMNFRCNLCADHTSEFADISTGDAWMEELSGDDGWNIIISRTEIGDKLILEARQNKNIECISIDASKVKVSQPHQLHDKKDLLFHKMHILKVLGLKKTVPSYSGILPPKNKKIFEFIRPLSFIFLSKIAEVRYLRFIIVILLKIPKKSQAILLKRLK